MLAALEGWALLMVLNCLSGLLGNSCRALLRALEGRALLRALACLSGLVAASCRAARPSCMEGWGLRESGRLGLGVRMRRLLGSRTGDGRLFRQAFCNITTASQPGKPIKQSEQQTIMVKVVSNTDNAKLHSAAGWQPASFQDLHIISAMSSFCI